MSIIRSVLPPLLLPPFAVLRRLAPSLLFAGTLAAQAVPRTDTPRAGTFRVTFEPVISTWEYEFSDGQRQRIGAGLLPPTMVVRAERRETPLMLEFGITNRLAIGVKAPIVRQSVRESFVMDSAGNPVADTAAQRVDSLINDPTYAFAPFTNTSRRLRYFPGDVEVGARYRVLVSTGRTVVYTTSIGVTARLATGHQDSPNDLFDLSTGDHQTDLELAATQELTLFHRFWLNAAVRAGRQMAGTRWRRVGPETTLLIPRAATALLDWKPGDYAGFDVAPMYRFGKMFAVGVTAGYWTKQRDHYTYQAAQDSVNVSTALGAPTPASVLDPGTSVRRLRLGAAMTYVADDVEGSFSFDQTVSASGVREPAASVFRLVMRVSRWPF